jgi:hypothetical protein|tara:strand:+ start:1777 stop:3489 length:1713 start_codon:yes stop_codon:yes gene_type:complete
MPQEARPGEKTILQALSELAGYEDIRTSEDLGKLSESEIFSEWVLPAVTGASAETDEYQPGALDLAFTVPVVGGSIKTGFKLAKQVGKKLSKIYKGSVRPKVFPQKDELMRLRDSHYGDEVASMDEWFEGLSELGVDPEDAVSQISQRRVEAAEEFFRDYPNLRLDISQLAEATPARRVRRWRPGSPGSYHRGDYGRQAATPIRTIRTADESIAHIIRETEGTIRGGVGGGNLTYSQARSIYDDIGLEGFNEFKEELLSMPQDARELAVDNFMAKYKLSAGVVSGQDASVVYKQTRFTSNMPDQVITTSKGSTKLEVKTYKTGKNKSEIRIEMEPFDYKKRLIRSGLDNRKSPGKAYASFSIEKIKNKAGESFDRVYNVHFYGTGGSYRNKKTGEMMYPGQRYAGLIMHELLEKVPPNTLIDESILTYDSLYALIKSAIRTQSKIIFNNPNLRRRYTQTSGVGDMSPITKIWNEMVETGRAADEATDSVISELDKMINQYAKKGMVEGVPDFKRKGIGEGNISYNAISVHKLGALVAGVFGFKNREAFMEFLSYNPESTEAQVFDNEFSL